jgi:hypothetical protein
MGGFNKLIGRYTPYGDYPYLIQQNAKIRQMNSLVQRDSGNLYKQIADPYGKNPFGEFGTDIQGLEIQGQADAGMSIERTLPTEPPGTGTGTDGTGTDGTGTGTDGTGTGPTGPEPEIPVIGSGPPEVEETTAEDTTAQQSQEPEVKQPTFKYNRVDIPFCKGYYNTPWYNWNFNKTQQTALNFLQARGDEMLISHFSEENKYPPLASLFLLPNTNPKFTKYNYSDRQMAYLYHNRNPAKFRYICPRYDMYVTNWCNYFYRLLESCKDRGINFTEDDIYQLVRVDTMTLPSYEIYARDPVMNEFDPAPGRGGGRQEINMGGYLNWQLIAEFKKNKSAAIAKVNAFPKQNVYIPGTLDTFLVSTDPRPETGRMHESPTGEFIEAPSY